MLSVVCRCRRLYRLSGGRRCGGASSLECWGNKPWENSNLHLAWMYIVRIVRRSYRQSPLYTLYSFINKNPRLFSSYAPSLPLQLSLCEVRRPRRLCLLRRAVCRGQRPRQVVADHALPLQAGSLAEPHLRGEYSGAVR